ncbi:hypothetical protein F4553_002152 [Allocatelliglobosispora scoriae]|uniref:Uncharacterized protein n=1 Tax=Allocatelliglobosispora scoriae TaxID=643052 RepID=A0A841BP96_9ACTN|nr:hypothetical protein [Allocatelliglobosispora scoriae]MBB5868773.1 hypothetical protein [Allocatelliglobosispora scoriae]
MAGRMLRWGLPRDPRAVPHLLAFVVTAVATVLVVRGALAATGYPQIGGGGLHVAHVLWGGLLMTVAIGTLLSFVGPVARPLAAIVGGIGFGLFIDEVGKFVTADTDYFYRPAVAIMYVVLVLLVLGMHWLHGRRPLQPAEYLASALDEAVAGVAGGLDDQRRDEARQRLALAGGLPGSAAVGDLLDQIPHDPSELIDPTRAVARRLRWLNRIWTAPMALSLTKGLLVLQTLATLVTLLVLGLIALLEPGEQIAEAESFATAASTAGATASAICVIIGTLRRKREPASALAWLQRAVLVDLLVTRVFAFALEEFAAVPSVLLDLAMLTVLGVAQARAQASAVSPAAPPSSS